MCQGIKIPLTHFVASSLDYHLCYVSNTFLFLFANKMFVHMSVSHKMLVGIANREYPNQTASSEAV